MSGWGAVAAGVAYFISQFSGWHVESALLNRVVQYKPFIYPAVEVGCGRLSLYWITWYDAAPEAFFWIASNYVGVLASKHSVDACTFCSTINIDIKVIRLLKQ